MSTFLLARLANYVVLVFVATSLAYLLAASSLNPRANFEGRNPAPPTQVVDAQLNEVNLNDKVPLLHRYRTWLSGVARGDFGRTWDGNSVNAEMRRRIVVSLRLLVIGTVLGGAFGIAVGAWSAISQYRLRDHAVTVLSFVILSIPVFVLAILLQLVAVDINNAVGHRVLEYSGEYTPGLDSGPVSRLVDRLQHLVLPTLTIVLGQIALISRYQRHVMLDVLRADFVRTALAKGLPRRTALVKHALRTALIPAATLFAYTFSLIFVGATFTEKIFGWHGMGEWFVDSVTRNDVNAVAAINCFVAVLVLIAGLLSDLAYVLLDPRVRIR